MPTTTDSHDPLASRLPEIVAEVLTAAQVTGTALLVGVSGGADSIALLTLLLERRSSLQLQLTAAHFDHALRPDSAADADWLSECCRHWRVPFLSARWDHSSAQFSEETARNARRDFLQRAAHQCGARWIALAHTADDQVETLLHRLLRGTGPLGLGAMSPVAPLGDELHIVRPLLDVRRSELQAWLSNRGETWRDDVTNSDLHYTRNRLRHTLLPLLRDQFNPQVDAALLRLSRQCRELGDWLRALASAALADAMLEQQPLVVRLSLARLESLPPVLRRQLFLLLWEQQRWPQQRMSHEHWETLAAMVFGESDSRRQFPGGIDAVATRGVLRLTRQP